MSVIICNNIWSEDVKNMYLKILFDERRKSIKNGLYDYLNVNMSYNTNRIEGSTLSLPDTEMLYAHNYVATGGHSMDDLIESKNHFELFDFMLDTINEPLSERLIKEYHQLLKKGTSDDKWYGAGTYKKVPNMIGGVKVAQPYQVKDMMFKLVNEFNEKEVVSLKDVVDFHYKFERIHPFQDGNGRVGRMIMLKQSLLNDITPFVVMSDRRDEYIEGLRMYEDNPKILIKEIEMQQKKFKEVATPFVKHYHNMMDKDDELEI